MIGRAPTGSSTTSSDASDRTGFYSALLEAVRESSVPVRVGGTCAINLHVGMSRETKDLDLFCRPGDYPRLLTHVANAGFTAEVEDERWVAKVWQGSDFCDIVFGSANTMGTVTDEWLKDSFPDAIASVPVKLLPPTELIFSKAFIMDRVRFDGSDIAHLILKKHQDIHWERLLRYMDQHWEVLLLHVVSFRYIYPSERDVVPRWLTDELLSRLRAHLAVPKSNKRVCRGRMFSRDDYQIDIDEWGFADVVGDHWTPPRTE